MHIAIVGERGQVSRALQARLGALSLGYTITVMPTEVAQTMDGAAQLVAANLVVLAVQDFASPSIVALLPESTRILDISPAFRVTSGWDYGLPELPGQATRIKYSARVANPGCFATAAIVALEPLVRAQLLDATSPLYLDGVGGYTTGGAALESKALNGELAVESLYSVSREHRHINEIKRHAGLKGPVWFTPKIANYPQGIRMLIPLPGIERADALAVLAQAYEGSHILVEDTVPSKIVAHEWANKEGACLRVIPQEGGCLVVCLLDNLGKGAVDSAVENIRLMLS